MPYVWPLAIKSSKTANNLKTSDKIVPLDIATHIVHEWKTEHEEVVFTNGCFDILHVGHIDYLEKAAQKGDKLVVGLNTDSSVKRQNKGTNRPINNEWSRSRVIAALGYVHLVILFDDDTPLELIRTLKPDILVKGSDYLADITDPNDPKYIVGSDIVKANGGKVETIDLVQGYSTTNVINKISGN